MAAFTDQVIDEFPLAAGGAKCSPFERTEENAEPNAFKAEEVRIPAGPAFPPSLCDGPDSRHPRTQSSSACPSQSAQQLPLEAPGTTLVLQGPLDSAGREYRAVLMDPGYLAPAGVKTTLRARVIPHGEEAYQGGVPWYVMIRDKRYKYVRALVPDLEELYDLQQDPEELDNLAVKAAYQELLKRMRVAMIAELRRTKAGFVDRMPPQPKLVI